MLRTGTYVTGSAKTRHNSTFSNYILLHFYNVQTQMYVLTKFQLCIQKAFEVTALQSSSNRRLICTVSIGKITTDAYKNGCNLQME